MTIEESSEIVPLEEKDTGPNFFSRFVRGLLRLLLAALVGAVLGGALYFGARSFYHQAVLAPAQDSLTRMDDLSSRQALLATQSAAANADLLQRINLLEKKHNVSAEDIASLQAEVASLGRQLEQSQAALGRLDGLDQNLSAVATQSMANRQNLDAFLSSSGSPVSEMRREIQLLRAMELLNRCRLYLSQNNYGLAAQDAALVRQIFVDIKKEDPGQNQMLLNTWIERLDLAITNLTVAPVLAGEDLEMVWRMVLLGLPPTGAGTPAPDKNTFTPTPPPWFTPTPFAQTATPTTTPLP